MALVLQPLKELIAAAEAQGVSRREIARRAGISEASLSRFIAGKVRHPSYIHILRLAIAVGKDLELVDFAPMQ